MLSANDGVVYYGVHNTFPNFYEKRNSYKRVGLGLDRPRMLYCIILLYGITRKLLTSVYEIRMTMKDFNISACKQLTTPLQHTLT